MENDRPNHLFLVEDDAALSDMLAAYLRKQGFVVTAMTRAEELLERLPVEHPDLVLLDIGLPGLNGLDACRKLRTDGIDVPLMILSARNEEIDRVLGLEMGADDYLGKPVSTRELLARIRALLRRATHKAATAPTSHPPAEAADVRIGDRLFMMASRSLQHGGDMRILSAVEYAILSELVLNPNEAITRERLLEVSHALLDEVMPRAIDAAIVRLRKILEPEPARPRYIQTVRGHGYVFVP